MSSQRFTINQFQNQIKIDRLIDFSLFTKTQWKWRIKLESNILTETADSTFSWLLSWGSWSYLPDPPPWGQWRSCHPERLRPPQWTLSPNSIEENRVTNDMIAHFDLATHTLEPCYFQYQPKTVNYFVLIYCQPKCKVEVAYYFEPTSKTWHQSCWYTTPSSECKSKFRPGK